MESGLKRNQVVRELTRSAHGALNAYVPVGHQAAAQDPEFFAHLVAWDALKGQVRDAHVALPVLALAVSGVAEEFVENALAHLAKLDPRNLVRALDFSRTVKVPGHGRALRRLVEQYLRAREANWTWWERSALQHRASLKTLYARFHLKPGSASVQLVLNGRFAKGTAHAQMPAGTAFEALARLKEMSDGEAATAILEHRLPFLTVVGAVGKRLKESDALALALIERMSPAEAVTNSKMLEKLGVRSRPALRAAYELALERVAESKKVTLKTTKAAEAVQSEALQGKLRVAQEKQLDALGGVDGNWLVLGDKSGSMEGAIETAKLLASTLTRMVKGQVHLVFFNTEPTYLEATGLSYEELLERTKYVRAGGGTSIGCGLTLLRLKQIEVDGIAIVSDGAENTLPFFVEAYQSYSKAMDREVPVYLYRSSDDLSGYFGNQELSKTMERAGISLQEFDLRGTKVDFYSLPNLVQTMRTSPYSLAEEVLETPLLRLSDVFRKESVA